MAALVLGTAAFAQEYGPVNTTTTTTSSTTSTTGTTIPSGSGTQEEPTLSQTTIPPGGTLTVSITPSLGSVSGRATTTPAPCGAGVPVGIFLQLLQSGQTPVSLASVTSNASGGLNPVSVTIPASAVPGTYVLFAQCNNASGILVILTSPLVVVGSSGAHAAAPHAFTTSSSFGTPAQQAAVNSAVQAQIARASTTGGSGLPNGGIELMTPHLTAPAGSKGSSPALFYGLAALVVALTSAGLVALRRQHGQSQA